MDIPVDTEAYDLPETLETLQQWYTDTGLESFFNAEATINNIPVKPVVKLQGLYF